MHEEEKIEAWPDYFIHHFTLSFTDSCNFSHIIPGHGLHHLPLPVGSFISSPTEGRTVRKRNDIVSFISVLSLYHIFLPFSFPYRSFHSLIFILLSQAQKLKGLEANEWSERDVRDEGTRGERTEWNEPARTVIKSFPMPYGQVAGKPCICSLSLSFISDGGENRNLLKSRPFLPSRDRRQAKRRLRQMKGKRWGRDMMWEHLDPFYSLSRPFHIIPVPLFYLLGTGLGESRDSLSLAMPCLSISWTRHMSEWNEGRDMPEDLTAWEVSVREKRETSGPSLISFPFLCLIMDSSAGGTECREEEWETERKGNRAEWGERWVSLRAVKISWVSLPSMM